ncbi:MAG: DUF2993 domain-containing protein [Prochlorothrix sp.]
MAPTQLIRKVLSPAVRLWLRSQVDSVVALTFEVGGTDRQLLSGEIPTISILGEQVVYQGLCLSHIDIVGEGIKTNLRQVLRGKPFQLLEPIFVQATLRMIDRDMNQCLQAPLLANALSEVLDQWLEPLGEAGVALAAAAESQALAQEQSQDQSQEQSQGQSQEQSQSQKPAADLAVPAKSPHWRDIRMQFQPNALTLWATLVRSTEPHLNVTMGAIVQLRDPHTIILDQLTWDTSDPTATQALAGLDHLTLNLGADVDFQTLALTEGQVLCEGRILIRP